MASRGHGLNGQEGRVSEEGTAMTATAYGLKCVT
jgi:hypothetical protein